MEPTDYLVHVNALLPCLVVYYALAIQKNVFLAVALYELVLVFGPILTQRLRRESTGLRAVERLGRSLTKPRKWTTCVQATTGTLCAVGFGGFFIYLTMFQRPLKVLGIEKAIRDGTAERGLVLGSVTRDAFLVFVGVWFCTVNPLVEELFWRGYVHAELGRQLGSSEEEVSSEEDEDDASPRRRSRGLLDAAGQTETSRLLAALYFGSFHGVVGYVVAGVLPAVVVFAALVFAGRAWTWLGERHPFGFPFLVASHAGCDVWVVLAVSALDFRWAHQSALRAALAVSLVLCGVGVALLAMAWRHETFPSRPRCITADEEPLASPLTRTRSSERAGVSLV